MEQRILVARVIKVRLKKKEKKRKEKKKRVGAPTPYPLKEEAPILLVQKGAYSQMKIEGAVTPCKGVDHH